MRWWKLGMLMALVAGCVRLVAPSANTGTGNKSRAEKCGAPGECATGFCEDGVCCIGKCALNEACDTGRSPGSCTPRQKADPCSGSEGRVGCNGLYCVEGVCCSEECAQGPTYSCSLAGFEGSCRQRTLASACASNDQCPAGNCVDGVCCDSPCTLRCMSCALDGKVGQCAFIQDNTDPNLECGGVEGGTRCRACFSGQCLPALSGTDPKNECAGPLMCNAGGGCAQPRGGACAQDSDCAQGTCALGRCTVIHAEPLTVLVVNPLATSLAPVGVALTEGGDLAVAWREEQIDGVDLTAQALVARRTGDGWVTQILLDRHAYAAAVELIPLGSFFLAAVGLSSTFPALCDEDPTRCTLFGQWVDAQGHLANREVIWDFNASNASRGSICQIRSLVVPGAQPGDRRVLLAVTQSTGRFCGHGDGPFNTWVLERPANGAAWKLLGEAPVLTDTAFLAGMTLLDGVLTVVDKQWSANGTDLLRATRLTSPVPQTAILPADPTCNMASTSMQRGYLSTAQHRTFLAGQCAAAAVEGVVRPLTLDAAGPAWQAATVTAFSGAVILPAYLDNTESRFLLRYDDSLFLLSMTGETLDVAHPLRLYRTPFSGALVSSTLVTQNGPNQLAAFAVVARGTEPVALVALLVDSAPQ